MITRMLFILLLVLLLVVMVLFGQGGMVGIRNGEGLVWGRQEVFVTGGSDVSN